MLKFTDPAGHPVWVAVGAIVKVTRPLAPAGIYDGGATILLSNGFQNVMEPPDVVIGMIAACLK